MEEIEILNWIHSTFQCSAMDGISFVFEYVFKSELIWIVIAIILFRNPKYRKFATVLLIALAVEMLLTYPTKFIIDNPRPYQMYDVPALITSHESASFPSSHAASLFCVATVVTLFYRRAGMVMFALAFFVAFTRMYMYAHFPTDVLAGALIGIGSAFYTFFVFLRWRKQTVYVEQG